MDQTKTVLTAAIVSTLIVAFGLLFMNGQQGPQGPAGKDGEVLAGSYASQRYIDVGGVVTWHTRVDSLNTASTTACAAQGPAATTTATAMVRLDVSSTTASTIQFGTGSFSTATTTRLGTNVAVAANAEATAFASTTVVAPNGWVTVGLTGGTGTFSPSGACNFIFTQI